MRGTDFYAPRRSATRIRAALGFPYRVRDWMEINHNLFTALQMGKTVYFLVLLLIMLVAAFNIVATLIMVVMEKRKDIAVLNRWGRRAPASGRSSSSKVCSSASSAPLVGNVGGYVGCLLLKRYRFIELPKDVYSLDHLP